MPEAFGQRCTGKQRVFEIVFETVTHLLLEVLSGSHAFFFSVYSHINSASVQTCDVIFVHTISG